MYLMWFADRVVAEGCADCHGGDQQLDECGAVGGADSGFVCPRVSGQDEEVSAGHGGAGHREGREAEGGGRRGIPRCQGEIGSTLRKGRSGKAFRGVLLKVYKRMVHGGWAAGRW